MKYISDLWIENYRGIKDLQLNNLGDINILVGENNSGKTSILEAIQLINERDIPFNLAKLSRKRVLRSGNEKIFSSILNLFSLQADDEHKLIHIKANTEQGRIEYTLNGSLNKYIDSYTNTLSLLEKNEQEFILDYSYSINEQIEVKDSILLNEKTTTFKSQPQYKRLYNINYLSPIAHYYDSSSYVSQVIKKGEKQELIKAVQKFDENIAATDIIVEDGSVSIYMMHKELGNVPITVFGDGLKKVFVLSNGLINSKDGIFLIDEVETAIHYSALIRIFKWLVKTCIKLRVQVFLTSHSLEVIDAIIEAVREELGEGYLEKGLRVITLNKEKEGEKIKVRNLNGIEASKAREDYGLELR